MHVIENIANIYYLLLSASIYSGMESRVLIICDVQDRFRDYIDKFSTIVSKAVLLRDVSVILDIPVVFTEQYPKAFGHSVDEFQLNKLLPSTVVADPEHSSTSASLQRSYVFEKKKFSCLTEDVASCLSTLQSKHVM